MMLQYIIPLLGSLLTSGYFQFCVIPVLCLAIVGTVPCIIRYFVRLR